MSPPPILSRVLHLQEFEPDQLLDAVQDAQLEHYILGPARCSARLARWVCGDFSVDVGHYSFPVRAIGNLSRSRLCVGYMRRVRESAWVNGYSCSLETMEFYPANTELNYRAASDAEWVAIEFDEQTLQIAARNHLGHELDIRWKHVTSFRVPSEIRTTLDKMIQRLWSQAFSGPSAVTPILNVIATILDEACSRFGKFTQPGRINRQKMLLRADEYLRTNIASPFHLAALTAVAGTTSRTLQREFATAFGMTPKRWAQCLALHDVQKRLRSPDSRRLTVEAIARECGFRHMGRLADYYHQLFGEYPHETNRMARSSLSVKEPCRPTG